MTVNFMEGNVVSEWLHETAQANGFQTYHSLFGRFNFDYDVVEQSQGSVYGIWICCNEKVPRDIRIRAQKQGYGEYIPLYWGKDINPGSRIRAHFNTPKSTGGLNLARSKYKDMDLIFGVIYVDRYEEFEEFLIEKYPTLENDDDYNKGKSPSTVEIMR